MKALTKKIQALKLTHVSIEVLMSNTKASFLELTSIALTPLNNLRISAIDHFKLRCKTSQLELTKTSLPLRKKKSLTINLSAHPTPTIALTTCRALLASTTASKQKLGSELRTLCFIGSVAAKMT